MNIKRTLLGLSLYCNGNYQKMIEMIKNKEKVPLSFLETIDNKISIDCKYITILDENYPSYFKSINYPPILFYCYGNINLLKDNQKRIAIAGQAQTTINQKEITKTVVDSLLTKSNNEIATVAALTEISGTDKIVAEETMRKNGNLILYTPYGINYCPNEFNEIYDYCKQGNGLIISEHSEEYLPSRDDVFFMYNRLATALNDALIITSGKRNTITESFVSYELDNGKDIFVIPNKYQIDDKETGNDLTLFLAKEGANILTNTDDILSIYDDKYIFKNKSKDEENTR